MSQPPYFSTDGRTFGATAVDEEVSITDDRVAYEQSIAGTIRTPSVDGRGVVEDYEAVEATGATAGEPGSFTPEGSVTPADLAGLDGVTADPATAWTEGQYVELIDDSHAHWDGSAWVAGDAPAA